MSTILCSMALLVFFMAISAEKTGEDRIAACVRKGVNSSNSIIGRYARYDEIVDWIDEQCCLYPEIVQTYDIGRTAEGRSMIVLRIGFRHSSSAWSIWLDGGIHAREHIAPATVLYIVNELINGYRSGNGEILRLLDGINYYALPVFNPDGYEFSLTKNRLWRKNRRRINDLCVGVDLNRNWNIGWGGADSDDEPCSDQYAGDEPGTEPEVRNTVNFLLPKASEFIAFLTYHSFGQRIFTRWDYDGGKKPDDYDDLANLAMKVSDAIAEVDGTDYKVGPAPKLSYAYGGGSADWAKAVAGIKYSYLIELRDTGIHGFQLPVEEIIPTGKESWAGVREISFFVLEHHHPRRTSYNRSASAKQVPPRICANAQIASYVYSDGNISHGSTWQTSLAISLSTTIVLWQFGW